MPDSKEELLRTHNEQRRQLVATITGLKKQATKKTRRNVLARCAELQAELDKRQEQEIDEFEKSSKTFDGEITRGEEEGEEIDPADLLAQIEATKLEDNFRTVASQNVETKNETKSRKNRQKERLARRKAKEEQIRSEAMKEAANQVDYRQIELDTIEKILSQHGLEMFEIKPDGHCLFASVQDQLKCRHNKDTTVQDLRDQAAAYMKENADTFVPFLFDEETNSLRDLDAYTAELTSTAMWGSDMEILALAKFYDCPISVYIAGSSTLNINEEGLNPELKLAYLKHSYGLGEHYNSLRNSLIS